MGNGVGTTIFRVEHLFSIVLIADLSLEQMDECSMSNFFLTK